MKISNLIRNSIAVLALFAAVSCNSDAPERTDCHVDYSIRILPNQDLLDVADLTVTYIVNGEEKTEPITGTWSNEISYNTFPSEGGFYVTRSFKKDATLTKDSYYFSLKYETVKNIVDSKGNIISSDANSRGEVASNDVAKDNVKDFIKDKYVALSIRFVMVEKDGTIVFSAY